MVTKKTPMAINWRRWWCTLMVMHPIRGVFTSSVAPMPITVQLNLSRGRVTTRSLIFECLQLRNFQQWTNVAPELKFIELQFYMRFLHFLPVLDLKSTKKSIGDGSRALKCSTLPGKVIFLYERDRQKTEHHGWKFTVEVAYSYALKKQTAHRNTMHDWFSHTIIVNHTWCETPQ